MPKILVIGATGNVGRHVVAELSTAQVHVRALVRRPHDTALPANVELVPGDLTIPESLDPALDGIDAAFLLWTAPLATAQAAVARIARRVPRVVFLSSPHQTDHPFFQRPQPNLISKLHREIESVLFDTAGQWTILRPGMIAGNARAWWAARIRAGARVVRWPYAAAPTAPIDERDLGAAAARTLLTEGHAGKDYLLTGPQVVTHAGQIDCIGKTIDRSLSLIEISPEEALTELADVIPPPAIPMLLKAWAGAMEALPLVTCTVESLTARPAFSFESWAAAHAADFR